jgi:hypothetical protein
MVIAALCAVAIVQSPTVTETSLGKIPPGMVEHSLTVAPNNDRIAFVEKRGSKECVVIDGVAGKLYDAIPSIPLTEGGRVPQITFSRDGKRVGYTAKDGDKYRVVVDGQEGALYSSIAVGALEFSRDGSRWAHKAKSEGREFVVFDGIESKGYDYVATQHGFFSLDSKHTLFYAERNKQKFAVQDGVEILDERYHGHPAFFESGHATDVRKVGEKWVVYVDGMPSKPYDSVGNNIEFSPDGKRHLFQASDRNGDFLVVNGVEGKRFPSIDENSYKFTPDGRTVHVVKIAGESYVVIDDKPGQSYDWVSEPVFNRDGSSMAYVAEENDKRFVVVNGKKGKEYKDIDWFPSFGQNGVLYYVGKNDRAELNYGDTTVALDDLRSIGTSSENKRVTYVAKDSAGWGAFVDHKRVASFDDSSAGVVITRDGSHWAAWGKKGENVAVIHDGQELLLAQDVALLYFDRVTHRLICLARRNGSLRLHTPGAQPQSYDELLSTPYEDAQGVTRFIARRNGEIFAVKIG